MKQQQKIAIAEAHGTHCICDKCAPNPVGNYANTDVSKLKALHHELNQMTWMGADEGWDRAIEAVRTRITEMLSGDGIVNDSAIVALNSHERRWVENRASIIEAIDKAGFALSSNKDGWWLAKRIANTSQDNGREPPRERPDRTERAAPWRACRAPAARTGDGSHRRGRRERNWRLKCSTS